MLSFSLYLTPYSWPSVTGFFVLGVTEPASALKMPPHRFIGFALLLRVFGSPFLSPLSPSPSKIRDDSCFMTTLTA